jgi:hypothetical protein
MIGIFAPPESPGETTQRTDRGRAASFRISTDVALEKPERLIIKFAHAFVDRGVSTSLGGLRTGVGGYVMKPTGEAA